MIRVSASRTIQASPEAVFAAISEVERLPEVNPEVRSVEVLSEVRAGVGLRFRETRAQGKGTLRTELEVTEHVPPTHVRMVTETHGTVWDSSFDVRALEEGTELAITMDARPSRLLPKLLFPLMKGLFRKGLVRHVDAVAVHCEGAARAGG